MNKEAISELVYDIVINNLSEYDVVLFNVVEKLEYDENHFFTPQRYYDFKFLVKQNDDGGFITVHTEIIGEDFFYEMSCDMDTDIYTVEDPIPQRMKFLSDEWEGVREFFKDYLRSWETLESENISTPIVYEYVRSMRDGMERFEKNQILLYTTFEQSGLEVGGELFKLKEIFQNNTSKEKTLPSVVEPSFIDESDMLVSFVKEQIRNGTFEEWVGKQ